MHTIPEKKSIHHRIDFNRPFEKDGVCLLGREFRVELEPKAGAPTKVSCAVFDRLKTGDGEETLKKSYEKDFTRNLEGDSGFYVDALIRGGLPRFRQDQAEGEILRRMCIEDETLRRKFPRGYEFFTPYGMPLPPVRRDELGGGSKKGISDSGYDIYAYVRVMTGEKELFLTSYDNEKGTHFMLPYVIVSGGRKPVELIGEIFSKRFGLTVDLHEMIPSGVFFGQNRKPCMNILYDFEFVDTAPDDVRNGQFYKFDALPDGILETSVAMINHRGWDDFDIPHL